MTPPAGEVRLAGPADAPLFADVAEDVFGGPVQPDLLAQFLADPRHHIAIALRGGQIVGLASAVDDINPDKPAEMWINEVGVTPELWRHGIGRSLIAAQLSQAARLGCHEAWVLADPTDRAVAFYRGIGGDESRAHHMMFSFAVPRPSP